MWSLNVCGVSAHREPTHISPLLGPLSVGVLRSAVAWPAVGEGVRACYRENNAQKPSQHQQHKNSKRTSTQKGNTTFYHSILYSKGHNILTTSNMSHDY